MIRSSYLDTLDLELLWSLKVLLLSSIVLMEKEGGHKSYAYAKQKLKIYSKYHPCVAPFLPE